MTYLDVSRVSLAAGRQYRYDILVWYCCNITEHRCNCTTGATVLKVMVTLFSYYKFVVVQLVEKDHLLLAVTIERTNFHSTSFRNSTTDYDNFYNSKAVQRLFHTSYHRIILPLSAHHLQSFSGDSFTLPNKAAAISFGSHNQFVNN